MTIVKIPKKDIIVRLLAIFWWLNVNIMGTEHNNKSITEIDFFNLSEFYHNHYKLTLFILIILGFLLAFCLAEVGIRTYQFLGEKELLYIKPSHSTLEFFENPIFGHALSPNQKGWFVPHTHEYYTWVEVNSNGWPDVEHKIEKPVDTYRIIILGDSFVENMQVPLERRFFKQLEKLLNRESPSRKIEVIAMGRGNTGTAQQYLILKNAVFMYNPDMVIHMFLTANDVKNNSPILNNDPYLPYFKISSSDDLVEIPHQKRSERKFANIKAFIKNLRMVELLLDTRQKIQENNKNKSYGYPIDYDVYNNRYSKNYQSAWDVTKKLITESKIVTENSNAKYILTVLSNNEQVNLDIWPNILVTYPNMNSKNFDLEKPDKNLKDFCNSEKIDCLFMLPFFKQYVQNHPGERTHNRLEGHWNQTGTNLAAEFLTNNISSILKFHE